MMDKRERVAAAFRGLPVDHVPVSMWKHVPPEYWQDDDRFAECQARFYQATDVDFMKLSGDKYFGWPSPALSTIENAQNLYQVRPLGPDHPYIRGQIERTKKVVRLLGHECPAIYLIFAPLSYIRLQIGYPRMMRFIREDPEAMKHACRVVAEDVKLLAEGIIREAGADGIFYSVQNGEIDRFTKDEYRDWVMPSDRLVLDHINALSDMNAIHFCAWEQVPNRLSVWSDYKAPVISWSRWFDIMDIGEAKAHFGTTVWGGFDNRPGTLLYTADKETIARETETILAQGGRQGFILGSDCSIHDELPEETIRFIADIAHSA